PVQQVQPARRRERDLGDRVPELHPALGDGGRDPVGLVVEPGVRPRVGGRVLAGVRRSRTGHLHGRVVDAGRAVPPLRRGRSRAAPGQRRAAGRLTTRRVADPAADPGPLGRFGGGPTGRVGRRGRPRLLRAGPLTAGGSLGGGRLTGRGAVGGGAVGGGAVGGGSVGGGAVGGGAVGGGAVVSGSVGWLVPGQHRREGGAVDRDRRRAGGGAAAWQVLGSVRGAGRPRSAPRRLRPALPRHPGRRTAAPAA